MPVLRDHYYKLALDLPAERIEGALALLKELAAADEEAEWLYALNRLTKGLITLKQTARFGFSMALTELLAERAAVVTALSFLDLLMEVTAVRALMKGRDTRSVLFGRLFGLQALIKSDTIGFGSDFERVVTLLVELATTKLWLRETAAFTLCELVAVASADPKGIAAVQYVLQTVNDLGLNLSTEGVAIALAVPSSVTSEVHIDSNGKPGWKHGHPFAKGNLPTLAKALRDVEILEDADEDDEKPKGNKKQNQQKSSWSPRLPFVWDLILKHFNEATPVSTEKSSKKAKKTTTDTIQLREFWQAVVDEGFFLEKALHERKYWGFSLLIKFLPGLRRAEETATLITPNLVRSLINHCHNNKGNLHKIAREAVTALGSISASLCSKAAAVLPSLISHAWNFDQLTKSKTIDHLVAFGLESGSEREQRQAAAEIASQFTDLFISNDTFENPKRDVIQKWASDKLVALIRSNHATLLSQGSKGDKVVARVVDFFINQSFFVPDSDSESTNADENPLSPAVKTYCQEKLSALLADLMKLPRSSGQPWSLFAIETITSSLKPLAVEFDEELQAVRDDTLALLSTIDQLKSKASSLRALQLACFELMFSMVLLQLYLCDEEAVQVLGELRECFEQTFTTEADEDFDGVAMLTEILLLLALRKSSLTRKLVLEVWLTFVCGCDDEGKVRLLDASLGLLFEILATRENKEGQDKLFEGGDEYVAESENESGDEENQEKAEKEEEEEEEEEEEDNDEDSDLDSDLDSDSVMSDDSASALDKETTAKLAAALGVSNEVKFDDLSSDDDMLEELMDDDEMMAMDEQLLKIFAQRREALDSTETGNKRKQEAENAREQMVFFKHRVLDLLELACKAQPNYHLNLTMLEPLLGVINLTTDKDVGVKAHKILKAFVGKTKLSAEDTSKYVDNTTYLESLFDMLTSIHEKANGKSRNKPYLQACNQASVVVAKNIVSLDAASIDRVIDAYASTLKQSMAPSLSTKINPALYTEFVNWCVLKKQ